MKTRRYELDWLRVLVFGLLIFYHVSMYFNPWGWHIKNSETYDWMRWPLLMINQWRLEILFLISGMGTYFSLKRRSSKQYGKERLWRLGLPLLIGILLIVPPQIYIERVTNEGLQLSYWEYYSTLAFQGIYPEGNISWHHLWFLPYLLCYSLLLIPLMGFFKGELFKSFLNRVVERLNHNFWNIYWFLVPLLFAELTLAPFFPVKNNLIDDWYALAHYLLLFVFGFGLMHISVSFFELCYSNRRKTLMISLLAFGAQILSSSYLASLKIIDVLQPIFELVYMWSIILTVFGYAVKYLSSNSKYLKYLNEAVYPFYIFHQTVLIVAIYHFKDYFNSDGVFALFLIGVTFLGSWLLFELARRVNFLRPLFGLKGKF